MKKIIALALSLVLCISVFAAVAETPSITMSDLVKVEYETPVPDGFAFILSDIAEDSWMAQALANTANLTPAVQDAITAAGGAADWEMNEAFAASVVGADKLTGDVAMKLAFPTTYNTSAGVVFAFADGTAEGVPATVNEDGTISATFSQDLLTRLGNEQALFTVINAPAN